jgi:two-component system, cell cycle sensor histidine kinase and response regulator CckA
MAPSRGNPRGPDGTAGAAVQVGTGILTTPSCSGNRDAGDILFRRKRPRQGCTHQYRTGQPLSTTSLVRFNPEFPWARARDRVPLLRKLVVRGTPSHPDSAAFSRSGFMSDESATTAPRALREEGEALRFLVQAGELLASSLDYRQTLASIAELAVPRLADFVVIDLLQPDGSVRREYSVHVDPQKQAALRELARFSRVDLNDRTSPTAYVIASGEPMFSPVVPSDIGGVDFQPEQLRLIRLVNVRSLIAAPLLARGSTLGAITLGRSENEVPYDRTHFDLVVELARRAAFAVEHALLYSAAREAREEAERSQAALQGLVRASDHVILEFDAEGRYLSVAPTAAPKMYRPADELLGRTVREVFPAPIAARFAGWIETAVREQRSVDIEYPLELDRRRVWFAGSVSPVGKDRVVWLVRDITPRKVAQEALAESERRFRATFEQAAVGISHIDLTGRFLRLNSRLAEIVGYPRDELLRLSFRDITHPADRAIHVVQSERLLAGEIDSYTIEKRYVRRTGEPVWVTVTGSLVRKESGEPDYFISVVQDVHERRELEEQLIRAQKMEAVGRLAGGVAHEFNNALTTITGFSDLILRGMGEDDPMRPDIEEISRAAWRAAGVANRLMVFSSSEVSQPEVLDLGGVVAAAQRMLAQLIGEDIELQVDLQSEPTHVHADRRQLEQVIVNLAVNARDAMPVGGRLTVRTRLATLDVDAGRRLGGVVPGEFVVLTLQDTGQGMTPDVLARIFDPFFTTKEAGKGTGLGLSIVYGIVRRAGGAVEVESEPEKGTIFRIYLPKAIATQRGLVATGEAPAGSRRGERILLVEDDPGVRTLAERVMKRLGYDVVAASSGQEALRALTEDPRPLDLLMTDLVMPGMSGRELAETLKALQPGVRVLFTSGYSTDQVLQRGVAQGDGSFLEKPFAPEELERALRRAMGR